jgi:hypothetical protein
MMAFWAPWYSGKRLFWRVRLGAWAIGAAAAALLGLRFAPLGPAAFEFAFLIFVSYKYTRFELTHRQQRRQAQPPQPDA